MRKSILTLFFICTLILTQGCSNSSSDTITESTFALDTVITVTLFENDQETIESVFELIKSYEDKLSAHVSGSEVDQINANAGNPVTVSMETAELIKKSIQYSDISGGLFDITIGPLSNLWSIGSDIEDQHPPEESQIIQAKSSIDYGQIKISQNTVTIGTSQSIDLGGIAKGYITDKIIDLLEDRNIERAILNLGGNVYVHGRKENGSPYAVGIQNPDSERGEIIGIVRLSDSSVVTSGLYERYFIYDGILYHHILDPFSGYPIENNLKSVSIISPDSVDGDALSTTLFLLGLEKGYELAESLESIEAIFITKDNEVYLTGSLSDHFELTDEQFTQKSSGP